MSLCKDVGRWIDDNVVTPVDNFFQQAHQECSDARRWVEHEIRTPIETWRTQQEQQCREQECNWLCLCCNKWFCWIVTTLVHIIEIIIQVVGEWLVETICNLIVEIVHVIVMTLVHIVKWVVEAVVCLVENFCTYLIFLAGLALIAALVGIVASVSLGALPIAIPSLPLSLTVAVAGLLAAKALCELGLCRLLGVILWAVKWSIVLGVLIAIFFLSIAAAFIVVLYGGLASALIWALHDRGCPIPRLLGMP